MGKRIVFLSLPVVLAMLSQTIINYVDHVLIGYLPYEQARAGQAALGPALQLYWAIGGFLAAVSVGTQALTARRIGEQEHERAGQVMFNSLAVAFIGSALMTVAAWYGTPYLFKIVSKDPGAVALGVPYLQWRMIGLIPMVTTISYKSWFDGLGKTRVHMGVAITMNVVNFFLNVALIFGKWGLPAWGVTGSSIASMLSSWIGLFIMIAWSLRRQYYRTYKHYRASNLSWTQQWEIVKLSLPSGIATVFVMSGFLLFFRIVSLLDAQRGLGPIYAAATQNNIAILMLLFTACMAYGTATATLVGQSMGAKQPEQAARYGWEAVKLGIYLTLVLGSFVVAWPQLILRIGCHDAAVLAAAAPVLRICGALMPCVLTAIVFTQALFGAGNTRFVMFVEFGLHFFCLVPVAYVGGMVLHWGMLGVWCGAFVYIVLLCLIMGWKFTEGAWKEIRI
jgi:putative MATE family efflux protein